MKRGLQVILGILSLIPLFVAVQGVTIGLGRWLPAEVITPDFDSHYRYITGYYWSLSLLAWWIIPSIEKHTTVFRIIGGAIFFGGVGRLVAMLQTGFPSPMAIVFTGIELLFPLLILWQAKLPQSKQVS